MLTICQALLGAHYAHYLLESPEQRCEPLLQPGQPNVTVNKHKSWNSNPVSNAGADILGAPQVPLPVKPKYEHVSRGKMAASPSLAKIRTVTLLC